LALTFRSKSLYWLIASMSLLKSQSDISWTVILLVICSVLSRYPRGLRRLRGLLCLVRLGLLAPQYLLHTHAQLPGVRHELSVCLFKLGVGVALLRGGKVPAHERDARGGVLQVPLAVGHLSLPRHYATPWIRLSNWNVSPVECSFTAPVGPLRCLATIT